MMLFIISIKNRACNTFSENDFSLGVQTRFRLAEREGFEPSLRFPVLRP